jgi:hypothetical protein
MQKLEPEAENNNGQISGMVEIFLGRPAFNSQAL